MAEKLKHVDNYCVAYLYRNKYSWKYNIILWYNSYINVFCLGFTNYSCHIQIASVTLKW